MKKICVLGSGAWGTAISCVLRENGHSVTVYGKNTTSGYVATVVADKVAGNTTISYAGSNPWTTDEVTVLSSTNDNWVYWVVATVTGTTGKVATITTAEIAG